MKIDAVTIFPDYFTPLQLSLLGKAQEQGLVEFGIHDLRAFSTDNHNTVDDTPYGGGAGMVMLPEVWGKALDQLMTPDTDLIILTPAGKRFDQPMATNFSHSKHLVLPVVAMKVSMIEFANITKTRIIEYMRYLLVIMF